MRRYAADTSVSSERSKAEIERTLLRYGADQFMSGWKDGQAVVQFRLSNKSMRFLLPLPQATEQEFTHYRHPSGTLVARGADAAAVRWEQSCRQRWRALALSIKAKLEAVACGITTLEEEFLAHILVPGQHGKTVGQLMVPRLDDAYAHNKAPALGWEG